MKNYEEIIDTLHTEEMADACPLHFTGILRILFLDQIILNGYFLFVFLLRYIILTGDCKENYTA